MVTWIVVAVVIAIIGAAILLCVAARRTDAEIRRTTRARKSRIRRAAP